MTGPQQPQPQPQRRPNGPMATASPPAPSAPYYTPAQTPPAGTALDLNRAGGNNRAAIPTLFTPLRIRDLTLTNRFAVSPMCMYSADDGRLTDFHLVHLGQFAMRGAALTVVEATAVTANGRITPEDSGLWDDGQIAPLRRVVDFVHAQGQKVGIQLAHAGRKASTIAPWHQLPGASDVAEVDVGGWPDDVWAPSALAFSPSYPMPKELSLEGIESVVTAYREAAVRAITAGFDVIEVHAAHGYLLTEFLSPLTNKRTDKYGGSFENRTRLLREVIAAVRGVIPSSMPLFVRVSGTEWMEWAGEPSWTVDETIRLAQLLPDLGVDLLDVSSGGNNSAQRITVSPYYQVDIAGRVREALRAEGKEMLIGAVGMITNAEMARSIVQDGKLANADGAATVDGELANGTVEVEQENGENGGQSHNKTKTQADLVIIARQFLREPEFVLRTAAQLGVKVQWPIQYHRAPWNEHVRP